MKIVRFIAGMHFFVLIPVIGLAIAACILFIKGGVDIVHFIWELITGMTKTYPEGENVIVELVETVHLFLVGTVLFLTSFGLYQLFIQPLPLPGWLKVNNTNIIVLNIFFGFIFKVISPLNIFYYYITKCFYSIHYLFHCIFLCSNFN